MAAHNDAAKRESAGPHKTSRLAPSRSSFPPAAVREIFAEETEQFGTPLNTTVVWAHHPALLAAYRAFRKAMNEASLIPDGLKYLVYVRVASLNGCPF